MTTVLDAFVIQLGLDPKQLQDGSKVTVEVFNRTKNEVTKSGKEIEDASQKAAASIVKITTAVLGLYAALVGARSLKDFTADLTSANAALGRFAQNVNESPQRVAAWGLAVERMGGSSQAAAATFDRISKSLYDLIQNGQRLPQEFSQLQALTGMSIDYTHGPAKYLEDISAAIKRLSEVDPSKVKGIADGLGIDPGTLAVMRQYGGAVGKYLDELERLTPSNPAIKASQQLQKDWVALQQTAVSLANSVMTQLAPVIENILKTMTEWVEANREWLQTQIVEKVGEFAKFLEGIDWVSVGQGLKDFATGAEEVAKAIGGVTTATEVLFALWAGSKALAFLANLKAVFGGGATVAAGTGGGGAIAGGGLLAGAAGLLAALTLGRGSKREMTPEEADYFRKRLGGTSEDKEDRQPDYADLLRDPGAHADKLMGETTVDGRPVSKANPMPVVIEEKLTATNEIDIWELIKKGIKQALGIRDAKAAAMPNNPVPDAGAARSSPSSGSGGRSKANSPGVPYDATTMTQAMGIPQRDYNAFKEGLTDIEGKRYDRMGGYNNRYAGRYQMGPSEIRETARRLGEPVPSSQQFLADPKMQERFFENYTLDHYRSLMKNPKFAAMSKDEQLKMLGYAHNQGVGGANKYMNTGIAGRDGWGTSGTAYFGPIGRRLQQFREKEKQQYKDPLVSAPNSGVATGASASAAINKIAADQWSTTNNTSSVNAQIGTMNVNAPNATDAKGVAGGMVDGMRNTLPALANYGPR